VPLVRISLIKGKSAAYVRSIADGVHKALVETYDVPENDRFQLIMVVFSPNDRDDWSFGLGLASYVNDSEQVVGARR
jgi:phenylpyruvate tautomerase PptA (4-oxalocrotonate tautomerase family)